MMPLSGAVPAARSDRSRLEARAAEKNRGVNNKDVGHLASWRPHATRFLMTTVDPRSVMWKKVSREFSGFASMALPLCALTLK